MILLVFLVGKSICFSLSLGSFIVMDIFVVFFFLEYESVLIIKNKFCIVYSFGLIGVYKKCCFYEIFINECI